MEAYADAMQAKLPAAFTSEDLKVTESQIENMERHAKQLHEEMLAIVKVNPDHGILVHQQQSLNKVREKLAEAYEKKSTLVVKKYGENETCRDVVNSRLKLLYPMTLELYLAARDELKFPIDAERYKSIMATETEAMLRRSDAMIAFVREEVAKKMKT